MPIQSMVCPQCGKPASEYQENRWQCLTCGTKFVYEPASQVEQTVSVEGNFLYTCRICGHRYSELSMPAQPCKKCGMSAGVCLTCHNDATVHWKTRELCPTCAAQKAAATPGAGWGCLSLLCFIFLFTPFWFIALPVLCVSLYKGSKSYRAASKPQTESGGVKMSGCCAGVAILLVVGVLALVGLAALGYHFEKRDAHKTYAAAIDDAKKLYDAGDYKGATAAAERAMITPKISSEDHEEGQQLWETYRDARDEALVGPAVEEAQRLVQEGQYKKAVGVLSSVDGYRHASRYEQADAMLAKYGDAVSEATVTDYLAGLPEPAYQAFVADGTLPAGTRFDDPDAERAFRATLSENRFRVAELRKKGLADREAQSKIMVEAPLPDASKASQPEAGSQPEKPGKMSAAKVQTSAQPPKAPAVDTFVVAKRVDNIRRGPGTNYSVVRKTKAAERLPYSEKKGQWYKLAGDSEAWVHESVVLTPEQVAAWNAAKLEIQDWRLTNDNGFIRAAGRVKNVSGEKLSGLMVVVVLESESGEFISKIEAMVDFNPLLPGQTSTFEAIGQNNPAIKRGYPTFKTILGPQIPYRTK